jgi:hypothetical protein
MVFAIAHDVMADMALQYFQHQAVHRSTERGQGMQDVAAILPFVNGPVQSFQLSLQAPDARQQTGFVFLSVCHGGGTVTENSIGG